MSEGLAIRKVFSDKFLEKHGTVVLDNLSEIMGFRRATIMYYPFITSKGFRDVRNVFHQTLVEDEALREFYKPFVDKAKTRWGKVLALQEAVNRRIIYQEDSENWGEYEYWARPIETHISSIDDCDGYAVLLCYLLRLFGFGPHEVFVAVGGTRRVDGSKGEYHAYCVALDTDTMAYFPIEGSWYAAFSRHDAEKREVSWEQNPRYEEPDWVTNDVYSFTKGFFPWRFIS